MTERRRLTGAMTMGEIGRYWYEGLQDKIRLLRRDAEAAEQTIATQAETIHSLAFRFTEQEAELARCHEALNESVVLRQREEVRAIEAEAELARLREAARAVVEARERARRTHDSEVGWLRVIDALGDLRAVLSPESEAER